MGDPNEPGHLQAALRALSWAKCGDAQALVYWWQGCIEGDTALHAMSYAKSDNDRRGS